MGTALAFFLFYEGSNLFFAYCHPRFCTFEIQAFRHQKTAPQRGFLLFIPTPRENTGFMRDKALFSPFCPLFCPLPASHKGQFYSPLANLSSSLAVALLESLSA